MRERLEDRATSIGSSRPINRLLFDEEGFHGEDEDYYDPRSALLSEPLDRHAGLPIALSILYIEISRRIGVEVVGRLAAGTLPREVLRRVRHDRRRSVRRRARAARRSSCRRSSTASTAAACGCASITSARYAPKEILARELAHLKSAYLAQHDLARAAASIDRLLILDDRDAFEIRDRAALAMQMHAYAEAIVCLERYLALMPHADDHAASASRSPVCAPGSSRIDTLLQVRLHDRSFCP